MATASERYALLSRARNTILRQAREAARLTIPGLIPAEGSADPHDVTEQPYENLGARGVNNVAAKLLMSQFPPQRPFFHLEVDKQTASEMGAKLGAATEALSQISARAMLLVESSNSRPLWMEVFRHLIVAGNVLVFHPDDGTTMRMWRLDQYVVRRDAQGHMIEAVVEEEVYPSELSEEVRSATGLNDEQDTSDDEHVSDKSEDKVKLYTAVLRVGDNIIHYQEINDVEVPGSRGSVKADVAGWQALRWQAVPGSDYGRSFVSEYAGDFLSLEEGWAAVLKFAAEASRIITILDPNSGVDAEELAEAETGDTLTGYVDKIKKLQLEKSGDFNILWNVLQSIERRISQAFLLTANTIRDAERVTAEEIRAVAQELEDAFGGTYTVLSAEAQAPYARRILHILAKQKEAPKLPDSVTPVIVTGFSALGANSEVRSIMEWIAELKNAFGENLVAAKIDFDEVALRSGTGRGITDVKGLIKSADQQQSEAQDAATQATTQQIAPNLAKGAMDMVQNNPQALEALSGGQQQ